MRRRGVGVEVLVIVELDGTSILHEHVTWKRCFDKWGKG